MISVPPLQPFLTADLQGAVGTLHVDLTLSLQATWTILFGPSGAGKSTILHALCGLSRLKNQHITCDGKDLTRSRPEQRRFALVPQRPSLFPHLSARDNVLFSLNARNDLPRQERQAEVDYLLRHFQVETVASKLPGALSGGEQQRVALARALASRPRLLLLDEALSGMDRTLQRQIVTALRSWAAVEGTAILSVTHDVAEAVFCADAMLRVENGRITAQGLTKAVLAQECRELSHQCT